MLHDKEAIVIEIGATHKIIRGVVKKMSLKILTRTHIKMKKFDTEYALQ